MTAATDVDRELESGPPDVTVPAAAHPSDFFGLLPHLFAATNPLETLEVVAGTARRTFGCDGAGVVLTGISGRSGTIVAAGSDAARADGLQIEHHQGPAFDALTGCQPVTSCELRFESRWRFWSPNVADLGFRSVLSLALTDGRPFGALTLYSRRPWFFGADSLAAQQAFAQQASIAITMAVEREQLGQARDSRGIVGQAQGILMERYQVTADEAFAVLRRYSSHLNQRLRLVAERLVADRSLPGLDRSVRQIRG
jgi:ANTAR domain/GAF domain